MKKKEKLLLYDSQLPEGRGPGYSLDIKDKICPICMGYLLDHPTLLGWKKCPGCAYCVKKSCISSSN